MTEIHPALARKIHKHFDSLSLYFSATTQAEKDRANYAFRESNRALADWLMQSVGFVLFPITNPLGAALTSVSTRKDGEKHRKALSGTFARHQRVYKQQHRGRGEFPAMKLGANYDQALKQYATNTREAPSGKVLRTALVIYWTLRRTRESAEALATLDGTDGKAQRTR